MTSVIDIVKTSIGKSYLDEDGTKRLEAFMYQSMDYLDKIAGQELDYLNDMLAQELLVNRVQYGISNALDDFQKNYRAELIELGLRGMVENAQAEETNE